MISQILISLVVLTASIDGDLLTVAERTEFKATARYPEVVEFGDKLSKASPLVKLSEIGKTREGRSIPLWIVSDPAITTPQAAKSSGKAIVLLMGNIHAGEVDGKEALPMLIRDLALAKPKRSSLLDDLILLVIPIFNADGNERVSKTNRPGQIGPEEGMGIRENADGYDLNRDYMKLDTPEAQALVKCFNDWDPDLFFDAHTTNGSHHRYTLTYEGPKNLAGDQSIVKLAREEMLPEIGKGFFKLRNEKAYFYGNFEADHTRWTSFPANPRFGTTYFGLRNRLSILSEAYSYVDFKTRVYATCDFAKFSLEWVVANRGKISGIYSSADNAALSAGRNPTPTDRVAIRSKEIGSAPGTEVLGFVEEIRDGKRVATKTPRDYEVELFQTFEATESVRRPYAYVIPPGYPEAITKIKQHGIELETVAVARKIEVEAYHLDSIKRAERVYEGHKMVELGVTPRTVEREIPAGSTIVPTAQRLSSLVVYLLEARSDDGLATWNVFDAGLKVGQDFPVLRVVKPGQL